MGYIIKDTQGLVVTRLTDVGRRKISQGSFNISYFQVGDSEINYTAVTDYNQTEANILEPAYNAHNNVGVPQSTKNNVKYPYYLQGSIGIQYGIPFQASAVYEVYNTATPAGTYIEGDDCYSPAVTNTYCINSQYVCNVASFNGTSNIVNLTSVPCPGSATQTPTQGMMCVIYMIGAGDNLCDCFSLCQPILSFRVIQFTPAIGSAVVRLDRSVPDLASLGYTGRGRVFFYPEDMSGYDLPTPDGYWNNSVTNFQSICTPASGFVPVWNLSNTFSESPAGYTQNYYETMPAVNYLGTKEYYGYQNSNSQIDTSAVTYYDSFGNSVIVTPEEQKSISIVHYTNNTIVNFFGEKFATEAYDPDNDGATGQARNFRVVLPWLMWHKNPNCCEGTTFYIDPPGFDGYDLLTPYYIQSTRNLDMNNPGMRYYHLYDTNPNSDGRPSRVGKVFPDDKIIIFDDEEIVATMCSYSNRNYTLPAPRLGTILPGACGGIGNGVLDNETQCLWVTYLFRGPWQGIHCNYYQKICGISATTTTEANVVVSFGGDFNCMTQGDNSGFSAEEFYILAQRTPSDTPRPNSEEWRIINFTSVLSDGGYIAGGFIDPQGMVDLAFTVTNDLYESAPTYSITSQIFVNETYGFGSDYLFNGEIETDIEATIYEMRYLVNLPANQFVSSSNPTWSTDYDPYMSEIGLYDSDKNLLVLSKFQSPILREGIQQVAVKLDF
jgi:hypothetical protein